MNKRFSTLLAAALVAGGFSFNAMASVTAGPGSIKTGEYTLLKFDNSDDKVLSVDPATRKLEVIDYSTLLSSNKLVAGTSLKKLNNALWKVTVNSSTSVTGQSVTYSFTNKAGQALTVDLLTDAVGHVTNGTAAISKSTTGNTTWAWTAANGLYAVKSFGTEKGDSVFYFTKDLKLKSAVYDVTSPSIPTDGALVGVEDMSQYTIELTAASFNDLMSTYEGKLFFNNGKDVSASETNALKNQKWQALPFGTSTYTAGANAIAAVNAGSETAFFLWNGKEVLAGNNGLTAKDQKKKFFLVVDNGCYNTEETLNKLTIDTLGWEPIFDASNNLTAITAANLKARSTVAKRSPLAAGFKGVYHIAKDSLVLTALARPASIPVTTTLGAINTNSGYGTGSTAMDNLEKAVVSFIGGFASNPPADKATFAESNFESDGSAYTYLASGGTTPVSGKALVDKANEYIATLTGDANKAAKATAQNYLAAIKGLAIVKASTGGSALPTVTTDKFVNGKNFADGVTAMDVTQYESGGNKGGQLSIKKLSSTYVLTPAPVSTAEAALASDFIAPLIQPFATAPADGGNAVITEGLYYIKDMMKADDNKYYGTFYDLSVVNAAKRVQKEQAFNPYAQFIVEKTAGTTKGNYVISNRAGATDNESVDNWYGVTNVVDKDNNIYTINGDTIQLVAADDVDEDNAYIGFKYITANDAKNNKFTITSAAEMLAGQTIVMVKDSSLKIAESEMLFTLTPSEETEYGVNEDLINVSYTIYNDADSTYLVKDETSGNYRFIHESNIASAAITKFYMIAVDTDSTYVLADGLDDATKMVISTQYKTISAKDLDERNDMFIIKPQAAPASYKSLPKHVRIQAINGDYAAVNAKNQGIAVREGDLKADAYDNLDFIFWLDTAHYENAAPYTYYITKGVKETEEVAASRLYMWNSVDSAAAKDANKELPYVYGAGANRVMFRTASIMAQDTLLVPTMDAAAKIDTVSIAAKLAGSADGLKHNVKAGVKNFQFSFEFASKDADNEYNIVCQNNNGKNYVHNINGVLAMGPKEDAVVVNVLNVTPEDEAATGNETINAEGVKVIAANGGVQIIGAQGKKVVITNILGQTVANTVLSSDNTTIAAPQGVVVVAIEGEEAVKAIVK